MEPFELIGSIVLGSPAWSWGALAILALFAFLLLAAVARSPLQDAWRWGLLALKATAILLLVLCLLDPMATRSRVKPGENIVLLLADDSASMSIREAAGRPQTRGEGAQALLTNLEAPWQVRLAQDFDLRRYKFGAGPAQVESFDDLTFQAPASNLSESLSALLTRFHKQPLAAIFLFTDGVSTDSLDPAALPAGVPVFPVWSGETSPVSDLAISSVAVSQTNFEDAPVTVQAKVSSTRPGAGAVLATLTADGATNDKQQQQISISLDRQPDALVRFQAKPDKSGPLFYRLSVHAAAEPQALEQPKASQEVTLANNVRLLAVNRDPHVARILYVAGRPNWERKFLGRALEEDDQLQLVSLIRIARKEARFDFRGRAGDSSNSLFRGFKSQTDEETESFDQPVLVRLNTRDQKELSDGFPKTKVQLYAYDAVILDDIEAAFFNRDQLSLLDQFVSERGGGLLMLGGRDSYRHGKWNDTPVADALPVYLNRAAEQAGGNLRWQLTRDGQLEPWMRNRDTEQAETARLAQTPPLTILSSAKDIKPGARILAEVVDERGQRFPALVAQQYGRGRVGAVLPGDLWRWSLQAEESQREDGAKSWRQMARWLVGDVPRRVAASAEPARAGGLPATQLRIRVRDREFQPQDGARVKITVRQPDGTDLQLDAQPSLSEPGLFEALHVSRQTGAYVASIEVPGEGNDPAQSTSIGWTSDPAAEEFACTEVNLKALTALAQRTGGELIEQRNLEQFVQQLPYRRLPVMEIETSPLWHRPWLVLGVLACLAAEWGVRRRKGLR